MYERTVRRTRLALARQKGQADALKEAGVEVQQKPLTKAPKSGRKPSGKNPPRR